MKRICNFLMKILLKCVPVKKGRIVCTSFDGHYSDSPKALALKIKELKPKADIIWLADDQRLPEAEKYFKTALVHSFKGRYYAATAQIRIDNVYGDSATYVVPCSALANKKQRFARWLTVKKKQKLYTTWHGTPIKRMGRDQIGNCVTDFLCSNATMILDNQYTLDIMQHLTFDKMKMVLLGLPRNDALFLDDDAKKEIREKLGLPVDKKILLFAPSFRNDGTDVAQKNIRRSGLDQLQQIDFEKLFAALQNKFGGDWVFVCRFHYHVEAMVNWEELTNKYPGQILNGNTYDDMAEYLACTDILFTDVSSCSFDFTLTGKPCFLFFPDYQHYRDNERGFYCDINELPYPLSITFTDLIHTIDAFDAAKYQSDLEKMYTQLGFVREMQAAEKIARYILLENKLL